MPNDVFLIVAIAALLTVLWAVIFLYAVSRAGAWMHRKYDQERRRKK